VPGYLGLEHLGVLPTAIGDEQNINFAVPRYVYDRAASMRYDLHRGWCGLQRVHLRRWHLGPGGHLVCAADISQPGQAQRRARASDGPRRHRAPGVRAATVTFGTRSWIVVQWNTHTHTHTHTLWRLFCRRRPRYAGVDRRQRHSGNLLRVGTSALRVDAPAGAGLTAGAQNVTGTASTQISGPPSGNYVMTSTPCHPGGSRIHSLAIQGRARGNQAVTSTLDSDVVVGTTRVRTPIIGTRQRG
jgi:hypothetical protein